MARRQRSGLIAAGVAAAVAVTLAAPAQAMYPRARTPLSDPVLDPGIVVGAVGDMACDPADPMFKGGLGTATRCAEQRTSDRMLADTSITAILGLGDYQYSCGEATDWAVSYNPTWGRLDSLMNPVAGNHEYKVGTDGWGNSCPADNMTAQNYFTHFGASARPGTAGHFSFDIGTWHLIGLNAECAENGVGGCSVTSAQTAWLKADLAATSQPCVAAFWHQPLFQGRGNVLVAYRPWWNLLYAAHADVVLNGHVHAYERFAPMDPFAASDPTAGITEYVVGTGGEQQMTLSTTATPQPVLGLRAFGYLRLTLQTAGWHAEFVDDAGAVRDVSDGTCHAKSLPTPTPTSTS